MSPLPTTSSTLPHLSPAALTSTLRVAPSLAFRLNFQRSQLRGIQQQCFNQNSSGHLANLILRRGEEQHGEDLVEDRTTSSDEAATLDVSVSSDTTVEGEQSQQPKNQSCDASSPTPNSLRSNHCVSTQTSIDDASWLHSPPLFPRCPSTIRSSPSPPLDFVLRSGALNDFALAMHHLSSDQTSNLLSDDDAKAARYFYCAAARGMTKAVYNLGVCYMKGQGVERDERIAMELFRQAAEKGHPKAM